MTPEVPPVPAMSPSARFINEQPQSTISAPSSQDFWRDVSQAPHNPQGLSTILENIDALLLNEDEDGYIFKPKRHAIKNAKDRIKYAYFLLDETARERLPAPDVVPDGTGGIVIQWNYAGRALNAGFPPSTRRKDYIYYQSGEEYQLIKATLPNLKERLEWLINE